VGNKRTSPASSRKPSGRATSGMNMSEMREYKAKEDALKAKKKKKPAKAKAKMASGPKIVKPAPLKTPMTGNKAGKTGDHASKPKPKAKAKITMPKTAKELMRRTNPSGKPSKGFKGGGGKAALATLIAAGATAGVAKLGKGPVKHDKIDYAKKRKEALAKAGTKDIVLKKDKPKAKKKSITSRRSIGAAGAGRTIATARTSPPKVKVPAKRKVVAEPTKEERTVALNRRIRKQSIQNAGKIKKAVVDTSRAKRKAAIKGKGVKASQGTKNRRTNERMAKKSYGGR